MAPTRPLDFVRALWTTYATEGADAVRRLAGPSVEWKPLAPRSEVLARVHAFEQHGPCVVADGSLRVYRDHGVVDLQPSWVFFFRDGQLVRGAGFLTREEAMSAVAEFRGAAG